MSAPMEVLDLAQGEEPWLAFRRDPSNHPASYAAVVMGVSPFMTRLELLDAYATGLWPEPSEIQQQIFDEGHRTERLYRPRASEFLAQELYPVVGRRTYPSLRGGGVFKLSASMDGFWEDEQGNWECKSLNEEIRAALRIAGWDGADQNDARELPAYFRIQMEQQCMVMAKDRVLFTAALFDANGALLEERLCWYESDPDLAAEIVAAWKQFDADLITHKPVPKVVKVKAEPVQQLPVLSAQVAGALTVTHNFQLFGEKLRAYLATLPADPQTDQDFANLQDAVKRLDAAEKALDAEEIRALAAIEPINLMRTEKETLRAFARTKRLAFNTLVETAKTKRRKQILDEHQAQFDTWLREQNIALGAPLLSTSAGTCQDAKIAEAMSGKKSVQGWIDGANQAVADGKREAQKVIDRIRTNLDAYKELVTDEAHKALFADLQQCTPTALVFKDTEAFRIIVGARISDFKAREQKRLDDERDRLQREAEERAQKATAAPAPSPGQIQHGTVDGLPSGAPRIYADEPAPATVMHARHGHQFPPAQLYVGSRAGRPPEPAGIVRVDGLDERPALRPDVLPAPATHGPATLTITAISARLKFTVTAAFLDSLGVLPVVEGNSKKYREADWPRLCSAIRNHLLALVTQDENPLL